MKQEIKPQMQSENAQDLLPYLPPEIILNILLRIPTKTIMSCKCVCKPWCDLIETREFVKSHISKSVPGLAVYVEGKNSKGYKIVEFVDEHRLNIVFNFDLPLLIGMIVHSSVNGLLFVCNRYQDHPCDLFICNPITREYIMLPSPLEPSSRSTGQLDVYGFGVSKMSGQYKVVRIYDFYDCQVYTIGTGSWRRIASAEIGYEDRAVGAFLNGNLHWLAYKGSSDLISCLDLETERFSTFSPPPHSYDADSIVSVLGDYLCVCDTFVDHIDIWLMKEYGDEKSWTKEFEIDTGFPDGDHCPIKVFKDGDILMEMGGCKLLYYSNKHETIEEVDLSDDHRDIHSCTTVYAPSFLPLKTFAMENVSSF